MLRFFFRNGGGRNSWERGKAKEAEGSFGYQKTPSRAVTVL